jgi:hypothetical protein
MPILGVVDSAKLKAPLSNSYESIATTTVGAGGSGTITFSSIPSTFKHLQIRVIARGNNADTFDSYYVRYNGDSADNYTHQSFQGDGSTITRTTSSTTNAIRGNDITGNTAAASIFGAGVLDIIDYSSTVKFKNGKLLGGVDRNGTGMIAFNTGYWRTTAAITSITITPVFGTLFVEYSSFALYGIKG